MRGRTGRGSNVLLGVENVKAVLGYAVGDPRNTELIEKVGELYPERGRQTRAACGEDQRMTSWSSSSRSARPCRCSLLRAPEHHKTPTSSHKPQQPDETKWYHLHADATPAP